MSYLHNMDITIRPNLNQKGFTTIHEGRLGRKLDSLEQGIIKFKEEVIYKGTLAKIRAGSHKTVCAGLRGVFTCHHPALSSFGELLPITLDLETLSFKCREPLEEGDLILFEFGKYYKITHQFCFDCWLEKA